MLAEGFSGRRILVTGGAGFIGSHLVESLVAAGCDVTVLDDLSTGRAEHLAKVRTKIELVHGDARSPEQVTRALAGCDVVYQLAAVVSVPRSLEDPLTTMDVNVRGILVVLEAARRAGVRRMVLASSAAVYGDATDRSIRPLSPYGLEKATAEAYLRLYATLYGLDCVALRLFNVFGERQDPRSPYSGVLSLFVDRLQRGLPLEVFGDGEQTRDFIYVRDVARALCLAGLGETRGFVALDIGRGEHVSINSLIAQLAHEAGVTPRVERLPPRPGDIRSSCADVAPAREVLGFEPTLSMVEGARALWRSR